MCKFEDDVKTTVREIAERTSNRHSFEAYLLTECVNSQTEHEPQGGEKSERRSSTVSTSERASVDFFARERVARLSADLYCQQPAVRCSQRTSDCYEVNRVSVVPRYAVAVGSLKFMQRGNGDRENT